MTIPSSSVEQNSAAQTPVRPSTTAATSAARTFYWSVRRELWENRSLYVAPLVVAAFALLGVFLGMGHILKNIGGLDRIDPTRQPLQAVLPYSMVASVVLLSSFAVALFYCFGALHNERRDRGILFWKSMPVSDLATVLSKASIPLLVSPAIAFCIVLAAQIVMLFTTTIALVATGTSPAKLWTPLPIFTITVVMIYGIAVHALWFAPLYGWVLLVSAWAKRAVFLWAALPFVAASIVEYIAFRTTWTSSAMKYRLTGAMSEAFDMSTAAGGVITRLAQLDPMKYLATPNLWLGLAFAAVCIAGAVRLRRYREPL